MDKRVAVVGGREFTDKDYMFHALDVFRDKYGIGHIVSGGAKGADTLAESYAKSRCIPYTVYPADWDKNGKIAGYMRNELIVKDSEIVLAFPTKNSKGTWDTIARAEKYEIRVFVLDKYCKDMV